MNKIKIYTMYNRAPRLNEKKVYNSSDNVDRLSYVDNTTMIKRFVMEGKSLALARSQALRSGLYSGDMNEILNDNGIPIPVYGVDPVFFEQTVSAARSASTLSAEQKAVHEAQSDNKSNDSVVPNPTADAPNA